MSTNVNDVKVGDLMLFKYWGRVKSVEVGFNGERSVGVTNVDTGDDFMVRGSTLIKNADSADQFESTKKVTKTKIAEILVSLHNVPFTAVFIKADGTERKLRGRLVSSEHLLGRSMVEDLDVPSNKHRLRQVDHRTIKSLIVNGVEYVVK